MSLISKEEKLIVNFVIFLQTVLFAFSKYLVVNLLQLQTFNLFAILLKNDAPKNKSMYFDNSVFFNFYDIFV